MKYITLFLLGYLPLLASAGLPEDELATLRGGALDREATPPPIYQVDERPIPRVRDFPMEPPVIPHRIRNYQVDLRSNKCLDCHNRSQSSDSKAPMVSVTHFMDREGNFLADVSPRRYYCEQCHVVQTDAPALVGNDFQDIRQLLDQTKTGREQ